MRVLLARDQPYEPPRLAGAGVAITEMPSGSSHYQHDTLALGLVALGHEVFYLVDHSKNMVPPKGIRLVDKPMEDVDVVHIKAPGDSELIAHYILKNIPILATNHGYRPEMKPMCKWVYVSKTQAKAHNSDLYVWNGLNPDDYIFSKKKKEYVLFVANMKDHIMKGLDIALKLSQEIGFELVVAGSSRTQEHIDVVQALCDAAKATYVGDIRGSSKARLFANAQAFISPSRFPETFGITLAESLFCGTPVICSNNGAYSEIISPEVGFVCNTMIDYYNAFAEIGAIDPETCRNYAISNFHYLKTTANYIKIYQQMISSKLSFNNPD